jgi:Fe-S-cluster-containing hydrogenase component 2
MGMEAIRETMDSCKHCFMCRHACPVFLATKLDSHTPRGYALMLAEIDAVKLEWSSSVVDRFYQCSSADSAGGLRLSLAEDDLVRNGREEYVNSGAAPPRITETAERLVNNGVPWRTFRPSPMF